MTDDIRELALRLARQALDRNKFTELTYTRCKDGIDLDEPTTDLVDLVRLAIAEGRLMEREEAQRETGKLLSKQRKRLTARAATNNSLPANPYPSGSLREAWERGFNALRPIAHPKSLYMRAFNEGTAARALATTQTKEPSHE